MIYFYKDQYKVMTNIHTLYAYVGQFVLYTIVPNIIMIYIYVYVTNNKNEIREYIKNTMFSVSHNHLTFLKDLLFFK